MTVIDPFLDRSQSAAGARLESRETAMLRHDIRGALMGVIGAAGQLETAELGPEVRGQVERVCAASRTLAGLVGLVLGDEAGAAEADAERVETGRLMAHLRRRYAAEAADRGLEFVAEAAAGAPAGLRTGRVALGRMIDNLVGNALKFSGAGRVRLTLARGPDGSVVFRVADEGPGLAGEGGAPEGGGQGLEIVRTLAERAGAELSLGARAGGGVEAVLRFPPETADEEGPAGGAATPALDLAGLRVLLAEDNPTNQVVASQMLRSLNAEVTVCGDGVEALERFESEEFDLVVVDIEMPRLSGLDVIRAIRARGDARAEAPIVALTAYAMREHRERIAAAGANGLISKPVTSVEALGRGLAAHVRRPGAGPAAEAPAGDAAGDAGGGPVIDRGTYEALVTAIGAETMGELLDKVIADLLAAQRDLDGALDAPEGAPDRARIRSASHILISVAGAIGAARLQTCARELNTAAAADSALRVAAATRRCVGEIDAAVAFARERRAAG
jgi:two-component system aerobic respiration control sensor histidine kinase ArcB